MSEPVLYSLSQAAEVLGVHYESVARWVRTGKLAGVKLSRRKVVVPKEKRDAFLTCIQEGHPQVVARLTSLGAADWVLTCVVNVAELLRGVPLLPAGRRQRELLRLYRQVIGPAEEVLPITLALGEQFAEIDAALRRIGRPIPVNDVWLAALALVRGAILVTNDEHFTFVDGLATQNWIR